SFFFATATFYAQILALFGPYAKSVVIFQTLPHTRYGTISKAIHFFLPRRSCFYKVAAVFAIYQQLETIVLPFTCGYKMLPALRSITGIWSRMQTVLYTVSPILGLVVYWYNTAIFWC